MAISILKYALYKCMIIIIIIIIIIIGSSSSNSSSSSSSIVYWTKWLRWLQFIFKFVPSTLYCWIWAQTTYHIHNQIITNINVLRLRVVFSVFATVLIRYP